ncbi:MAG: NAD(P)H-hydrate epimerase, partial [Ilumatobacteraceae bacterium]
MLAIVTPEEMAAIDAASSVSTDALIERAGAAVAWAALRMLGGAYGRTVNVLCGKGNNGADGRTAARHLAAKGVRVLVFDV